MTNSEFETALLCKKRIAKHERMLEALKTVTSALHLSEALKDGLLDISDSEAHSFVGNKIESVQRALDEERARFESL